MNVVIRSAYDERERVQLDTGQEGGAKQSFKDECDINNVMKRFAKTGVIEHVQTRAPSYGYAPAVDYQEAMQLVAETNAFFEGLPSSIRNQFENNPSKFLQFVNDPENADAAEELGLFAVDEDGEKLPLSGMPGRPAPGEDGDGGDDQKPPAAGDRSPDPGADSRGESASE